MGIEYYPPNLSNIRKVRTYKIRNDGLYDYYEKYQAEIDRVFLDTSELGKQKIDKINELREKLSQLEEASKKTDIKVIPIDACL
jgi:hypothetical protein